MRESTKTRLTWCNAKEKGAGPRTRELKHNGNAVAFVAAYATGFRQWNGWYWYAPKCERLGIPWGNTAADSPPGVFDTKEKAEASCVAHIRRCLARNVEVAP
jgi:hypothetical protein